MDRDKQKLFTEIFLQAPPGDQEYRPFRCISAYLNYKYRQSGKSPEELAAICGYRDLDKFRRRLSGWLEAGSGMPIRLAQAIGINMDELQAVMETEVLLYQEALEKARPDESFSVKLMPGICRVVKFPAEVTDEDKIMFADKYCQSNNLKCCLGFGGLKTAWFTPGQKPYWSFSWPCMTIEQGNLVFGQSLVKPDLNLK